MKTHLRGVAMLLCIGLASAWANAAAAQSVRWDPPPSLEVGQIGKVDLVFDGCSPSGDVDWPPPPGLEIVGEPTESRVFSMVNFRTRTSVTLGFPVRARSGAGLLILPGFTVETDEGPMTVEAVRVPVGPASLPGERGQPQPLEEVAEARLDVSDARPYVGEVVDLEFEVTVDVRRNASLAGPVRWQPEPMLVEAFGQLEQTRSESRNGVRMRARGLFPEPGRVELPGAEQDINVEVGHGGVGLFRNRRMRTIGIASEPITVDVRPLPAPRPEGFSGAVGRFTLESKLVPEQASVGEPLTWSLVLQGEGNWTDGIGLPPRSVPRDIEVIQPRSTRSFAEGALFEGSVSEDLVLIPTRSGRLELEPVRFVYFDPERERYETLEVAPPALTVAPAKAPTRAPASSPPAAVPGAPGDPASASPAPTGEPAVSILPGARQEPRLPRAPVAGPPVAPRAWSAPWSPACMAGWIGLGLAPAVVLALALARRRAVRLDALAPRRAALTQVDATLDALASLGETSDAALRARLLLAWQRSSAGVLGFADEAPTARALDALGWGSHDAALTGTDTDAWRRLWTEVDGALYDADHALPRDWIERARAAQRRLRIVPVPWSSALRAAHVWPALAVWLVVVVTAPAASRAEAEAFAARPGLDAYSSGEFEAAAAAFEARALAEPLDWKARSDLGLARLQQGEVDAALAESAAAWVLNPRADDLRWNLAVAARRAGWIDPSLRDLAWGGGLDALARRASPAEWQWVAVASAWCGGCVLAWAVVQRHRGRSARRAWPALGLAVFATGLAVWMSMSWGDLADVDAAVVASPASLKSLPSELAHDQIEVALEAGRVVVVERAFLGWLQVRLANGDLGWVRGEVVRPVYRRPHVAGEPWPSGDGTSD